MERESEVQSSWYKVQERWKRGREGCREEGRREEEEEGGGK